MRVIQSSLFSSEGWLFPLMPVPTPITLIPSPDTILSFPIRRAALCFVRFGIVVESATPAISPEDVHPPRRPLLPSQKGSASPWRGQRRVNGCTSWHRKFSGVHRMRFTRLLFFFFVITPRGLYLISRKLVQRTHVT